MVNVRAEASAYQRSSEVFCKRLAVAMLQRDSGGGTPPPLLLFEDSYKNHSLSWVIASLTNPVAAREQADLVAVSHTFTECHYAKDGKSDHYDHDHIRFGHRAILFAADAPYRKACLPHERSEGSGT